MNSRHCSPFDSEVLDEMSGLAALTYYRKPLEANIITQDELYRIAFINTARSHHSDPVLMLAQHLQIDVNEVQVQVDMTQRNVMLYGLTWIESFDTPEKIPQSESNSWMDTFFRSANN